MTLPMLYSVYSSPVDSVSVGDKLVIATSARNCSEMDQPFMAIIEVRNSLGMTENLGWQSGVLEGKGQTQIGISWIPVHGDNYEIRTFAVSDFENPSVLSAVTTSNFEIAEQNTENLILEFNVTETNVSTGELYGTSYYLVNRGKQTVALTVDDYIGVYESLNGATARRLGPDSSCVWKYASKIENPDAILKPGEMMNLTERIRESSAPKYPGIYNYSPFVILSVQAQERVKCLEIVGNTVTLNVTGAPAYKGINLVLETDKKVYKVNEVVHFSLYIENTSEEPFVFTEDVRSIIIRSDNGTKILDSTWAWPTDQLQPITVKPHTRYQLDDPFPFVWNLSDIYQIPPDNDGNEVQSTPGVYLINATFGYPYLDSKTLEVRVVEE